MLKDRAAWVLVALLMCACVSRGQTGAAKASTEPPPAPRRDISGTWTPARGLGDGIGFAGARDMPEDGKPEHQLPYTPLALQKMKSYRPGNGAREALPTDINDPAVIYCDPQGMPRQDLYELRTTQILQTPLKVVILYRRLHLCRRNHRNGCKNLAGQGRPSAQRGSARRRALPPGQSRSFGVDRDH
jgi:hypothetical protein